MLRFVIIAIIIYLFYLFIKVSFSKSSKISKGRGNGTIDEMVQDPCCEKYIPRREAIRKVIRGNEIYFCSKECARRYSSEAKG